MEIQISPIQSTDPRLFEGNAAQTRSNISFERHLEQEKNRLGLLFSPLNQLNFGNWFAYPDFSIESNPQSSINLFSDIEPSKHNKNSNQNTDSFVFQNNATVQSDQITSFFNLKLTGQNQLTLQELLQKTGWLVPNLEASPLLLQASFQGKLLSKLDLQSLIDQLLTQIKIVKEKGKVEMTLGLKPENLGEILLTLTSHSGIISIQIQAAEETRKILEKNLRELELALKKAKVNLSEIKILNLKEVANNA